MKLSQGKAIAHTCHLGFNDIADCAKDWKFEENSFDYIHIRFMVGSVPDWRDFMQQAYRCVKPGGIVESSEPSFVIETDSSLDQDTACYQWAGIFDDFGKKHNQTFEVVRRGLQESSMSHAGFVDIRQETFKFPLNEWQPNKDGKNEPWYDKWQSGKDGMSEFCAQGMLMIDPEGFILRPATTIGWSWERVQLYLVKFRKEIKSGNMNAWCLYKDVWGPLMVWYRQQASVHNIVDINRKQGH
ncbi:hypothetical protein CaCOL14_000344 [Colletotrichum acutatum]